MEIKQSFLDTWNACNFIIRNICFHHGIHVHLPTGHNLQTIPDPYSWPAPWNSNGSCSLGFYVGCFLYFLLFFHGFNWNLVILCLKFGFQAFLQNWHNFQTWSHLHSQSSFWLKFHSSIMVRSQEGHFIQVQMQWNKIRVLDLFSNKCLYATFPYLCQWKYLGIFYFSHIT